MKEPIPIKEIINFIARYKKFNDSWAERRVGNFINRFGHIKAELQQIKHCADKANEFEAIRFNIFSLLDVTRDEVKTHSAFLADLLNPKGTHGQQYLFLEEFISYCTKNIKYNEEHFPRIEGIINMCSWFVKTDMPTAWGRPDIVISSPELKYLITIENKIDAEESDGQIKKYSDWMERSSWGKGFVHKALIYLTLDGRESHTASGCKYYRMSYKEDILRWLENTVGKIRAPKIKEIVIQYIEVIKTLSHEEEL